MIKISKRVILIVIVVLFLGWVYTNYQFTSNASSDTAMYEFEVEQGWGVNRISLELYQKDLINNQFYFEVYVWLKGYERNFKAGAHQISPSMSIKEIITTMIKPGGSEQVITIIEGWNVYEIAEYLEKENLVKSDEFIEFVNNPKHDLVDNYSFLDDKPYGVSLEGYLFPDTYRVYKNSNVIDLVKKMLDNFEKRVTLGNIERIHFSGNSVYDTLTLASIIEKEVRIPYDMKMVSDIFSKRLEAGIALQSDATVNYITGKGLVQPSYNDLEIDNPYNTYRYKDLPPGPIASPGLNAIMAVIEPVVNPYYYFLTTIEGEVIYSENYDQHLTNKAIYLD
ncbi:endolytic transglycosylase MltG [bacterium]|jgi:UPF0755 protein|nr:endolytic transglycosylase MltG [bacterium]MBT4121650.1 endolytic transglycosylase MltG [bacterium]MBT4335500.1 endolytic transglycosylase MltG [bacterium]MBT4764271.1 endolytic transglycosylase MltG [bacterium]MBT5401641.1 endolytic transglycosylase MltG [bacterium]